MKEVMPLFPSFRLGPGRMLAVGCGPTVCAQYVLHRLELLPVLPSFADAVRALAYSSTVQKVPSSTGSTWAWLKSPQRLRVPLNVLW